MKHYSLLVHVQFDTSQTKLDIYYKTLGSQVVVLVAGQIKTQDLKKLSSITKIFKFGWKHPQRPVFPPETTLQQ